MHQLINFTIKITFTLIVGFTGLQTKAQDTLTYGQVYDFEVGDVFHYTMVNSYGGSTYYSTMIEEYTAKVMTLDSIVYSYQRSLIYNNGNEQTYSYEITFDSARLAMPILTSILSQSVFFHGFQSFTSFDGRGVNSIQYTEDLPDYMEPSYYDVDYAAGLGITYRFMFTVSGPQSMTLVYFKKGDIEWGTQELGMPSIMPDDINIYPNPFDDYILLEVEQNLLFNELHSLKLVNMSGKLVHRSVIQGVSRAYISTSHLKAGTYLLQIPTDHIPLIKVIVKR